MIESGQEQWHAAIHGLRLWHAHGDREAARSALEYLEVELRLRIPAAARRRWPAEQVEDALQGFLTRLLKRPLPETAVERPAAYLARAFRNWCIDIERGRKRHAGEPWDDNTPGEWDSGSPETRQRLERVAAALDALSVEDRVAIKMTDAPEMLTEVELAWLGARAGLALDTVASKVLACPPVFELTLIFDPGPDPRDGKERRDRMERFRKRRERARTRLRALLGGDS